jgi:hypothetical protein
MDYIKTATILQYITFNPNSKEFYVLPAISWEECCKQNNPTGIPNNVWSRLLSNIYAANQNSRTLVILI